jgi:hypothetical protein
MKHSKYYLGVLLIIILCVFLRFFMLTQKSLWGDEGFSIYFSDGSNPQEVIARILSAESGDRFQPLYYLILFYWRQVFGDSEFALRSLPAFLGVGTVIVLFCTALQVYGKKHALWSVTLVAVSSFGVYYSQLGRAYALLMFLAALQLFFFSKALNKEDTHGEFIWRLLFWIVTGLGLFCSIFIGIFALSLCVSYILVYRNPKRWLQWYLPLALFCVPGILFYFSSPVATTPTKVLVTQLRQPIIQNLVFVIYGLLVGETYGPPIEDLRGGDNRIRILLNYWPELTVLLLVAIPISISLVLVLVRNLRQQSKSNKYQKADYFFTSVFAISFFLALLFSIATKVNLLPRHCFYIYMPLVVVIPMVVRKKYRNIKRFKLIFNYAQAAIIGLAILNIYSLYNYYFVKKYEREDYRFAAQYLLANQEPSVKSVLLYGSARLLTYYGDTMTLDGTESMWGKAALAEKVKSLTNGSETVIIAINNETDWERRTKVSVETAMSDSYILKSKISFTNFNMYHFVRKQKKVQLYR